jgi:transposase
MAYSKKFREHVLRVQREEKLSYTETAERFKIGRASVARWVKCVEPKKLERKSRKINMEALYEDVQKNPYAFQWERAKYFEVSQNSIHGALKRLGVTYKKSSFGIRRLTILAEQHLKRKSKAMS